jgi:hypothetical protein
MFGEKTMLAMLKALVRTYPATVPIGALAWSIMFALVDGLIAPQEIYAFSLGSVSIAILALVHALLFWILLIGAIFLVAKRKVLPALSFVCAAGFLYCASYAAAGLSGDRFVFTAQAHRRVADIYKNHRAEFQTVGPAAHLFNLHDQCDLPEACICAILIDASHSLQIRSEIGGWHRPAPSAIPQNAAQINFAILDLRAINSEAYSILACSTDLRSVLPR